MTQIVESINQLKNELPSNCRLVAVSKTKPNELILEAYHAGHRLFGENKVQDLVKKHETLPQDIRWHFIGHLQKNKVKYIASFVNLLHAVDSQKLLQTINKEARKHERTIDCLLQLKIANEESKFGMSEAEITAFFEQNILQQLDNVRVIGLMGMATYTDDKTQIQAEFKRLSDFFHALKAKYAYAESNFTELSMGMSGDYKIAVGQGSTLVRIGSTIFGKRN